MKRLPDEYRNLRLKDCSDTLSVKETAGVLGISPDSVYTGIKAGEIPAVNVGRRIIVPKAALAKMLEISL